MESILLVEVLTEELPPKLLRERGMQFASWVQDGLSDLGFLNGDATSFSTPRRLATTITNVEDRQSEQEVTKKGPSVAAALNRAGQPTQALIGFAKSCGVGFQALKRVSDAKGEYFVFRATRIGEPLDDHLAAIVEAALKRLPIAKLMRWGEGDYEFARPVHNLVMLHGDRIVPGMVLGVSSGRTTIGHRVMGKNPVVIPHASRYEDLLEKNGKVIPDFDKRFRRTKDMLGKQAHHLILAADDDLIEEVTALVEYPVVYAGEFDRAFLTLPPECLSLSMKQHQRYFPLLNGDKLLPRFLMVANIDPDPPDPSNIIRGNERVLRARLSDAKFFFDQDRKVRLEDRVPRLANVVYHNRLGSQLDRVERITALAGLVAQMIDADRGLVERAARLCKADLTTEMVGEFPELQGTMGRYYAFADGEPEVVANAIEQHYRPRFSGDVLPEDVVAISVALADKLEALAGMFGIGQQPTGDKDPFALRRHALGIVRIVVEHGLKMPLTDLVDTSFSVFSRGKLRDDHADLEIFMFERLRGYLRDQRYSANEVEAVLCLRPTRLDLLPRQLAAVRAFTALAEAKSLAAANKRVVNILKQAQGKGESFADADPNALRDPHERALFDALQKTAKDAAVLFARGDFEGYLKSFAVLKTPVDAFFDSVMVMVEDRELRKNRLALLADLRREMNRVADISKLAA